MTEDLGTINVRYRHCSCVSTRALKEALGGGNICPRCNKIVPPENLIIRSLSVEEESFDSTPSPNLSRSSSQSSISTEEEQMEFDNLILRLQERANLPFKLNPFSGSENEDLDSLLNKFDTFCTQHHKDDAYKAAQIPLLLTGRAYKVYKNFSDVTKDDYELVCQELQLNFGPLELPPEIAYPQLSKLKMDPKSTVQTFFEKLTTQGRRLDVSPEMLKAFFIDGLSKHLKTYVLLRQPDTISRAFQMAKQAEQILPHDDSSLVHQVKDLNSKLEKLDEILSLKTKPTTAAITFAQDHSFENMEKKIQELENNFNNFKQRAPPNQNPLTCHNCSQLGHTARQCKNLPSNQFRSQIDNNLNCQLCFSPGHSAGQCENTGKNSKNSCQLCFKPGHSASQCRKLNSLFNRFEEVTTQLNQNRFDRPQKPFFPGNNNARTNSRLTCYHCGKPGHYSRDCFQNNNANPNRNQSQYNAPLNQNNPNNNHYGRNFRNNPNPNTNFRNMQPNVSVADTTCSVTLSEKAPPFLPSAHLLKPVKHTAITTNSPSDNSKNHPTKI